MRQDEPESYDGKWAIIEVKMTEDKNKLQNIIDRLMAI